MNTKKYLTLIFITLLAVACSTQKNTGIRRAYHNVTSRYNILFNGTESYKKGMLTLEKSYRDDFSKLIPVFLYTDKEQLGQIGSDMDRAIKKGTKLISMHSLTVKPEYDPDKELTPKQKEFLSRKEYNNYVDDAYLLIGKAHIYKNEYQPARETFNYIVSNFGEDYSVYESKVWLARLAIEDERYREAEDMLTALDHNIEFPKKLKGSLYATMGNYYIHTEQYEKAIEYLKKAADNVSRKPPRVRYYYVIAQLYNKLQQGYLASEYFSKVISSNPPYEMAFNAKISRALSYQSGDSRGKDIEKQLQKMLRDDKNIDYQDQIYYALGNLYFKRNNLEKAIEYYKKSMQASVGNLKQKAFTSLTLADIFYEMPDYINAQAYYDSAVAIINTDYPNYEIISAKAQSLTKLVDDLHIIDFQDSVLALSYKPRSEIDDLIIDLIDKQNEAEEIQRFEQQQRLEEQFSEQAEIRDLSQSGNAFYFYNTTAKNLGKKEFQKIWGTRRLEDNWRRRNKNTVSFGTEETAGNEDEEGAEETGAKPEFVTNKKTPEFYLQFIPFTDSARQAANNKIAGAYYNAGGIYYEELKDYPKAVETYEELLKRYPTYENRLQVYYKLYSIAKDRNDNALGAKYKQKIISEFPESNYAKLMTNPNFVNEFLASQRVVYDEYEKAYNLFNKSQFAQAKQIAQRAMQTYPEHELYPKFDYIYTIAAGSTKDTLQFVKDLLEFQNRYAGTEIAASAGVVLNYLQHSKPGVIEEQKTIEARKLYEYDAEAPHLFVFIVPKQLNTQQLNFNILGFNLDNFDKLRLKIKRVDLNPRQNLMVIEEFENAETAMDYLQKITTNDEVFRDVNKQGIEPVVITKKNYSAMLKAGTTDEYLIFFRENYR